MSGSRADVSRIMARSGNRFSPASMLVTDVESPLVSVPFPAAPGMCPRKTLTFSGPFQRHAPPRAAEVGCGDK